MLCSGTDKRPFNRGSPLRIERIGSHGKNPYRGSAKGSICGMARSCSFPVQDAIAPLWNALTTSSRSASKSSEQLGGELRAKLEACEQEVEALCRIANVGVRNRCAADASQRRTAHHPTEPVVLASGNGRIGAVNGHSDPSGEGWIANRRRPCC